MREKGRMLAACMFAMAWWSIFYPELCFAEGTCETVQITETEQAAGQTAASQGQKAEGTGTGMPAQDAGTNMAPGILRAQDDEIVISSRFLEWCEEKLLE